MCNNNLESSETVGGKSKISLSEGFLIALSPVVAYILVFCYELGYTNIFGIPMELINPNLATIFAVGVALFALCFPLYLLGEIIIKFIDYSTDNPYFTILLLLSPVLVLFIISIFAYGPLLWREWLPIAIVLAVLISINFLIPLLSQKDKKTYREKLQAQEKIEKETPSLSGIFVKRISSVWIVILLLILISANTSYIAGKAKSLRQVDYLVIKGKQEKVVIRIYGDNIIYSPLNKKEKTVGKNFYIMNIEDNPNLSFSLESIGPLNFK